MIYGHLLPRISAFTVAAQHGEPINFASAPIKTDIAPFGEKSGRRFEEGETCREGRSKKFSLQNRENDFQNYITFTLPFFSISLLLYLSLPLSGFSSWSRFGREKLDVVEKLDRQTRPPKVISRDSFCQRACTTSAIRARAC